MLYIVYEFNECPRMPLHLFVWFFATSISRFKRNIISNFKAMKFGNVWDTFGKFFKNIFGVHKTVLITYNIFYKHRYEAYIKHVSLP